jgi:hypothetical protein
LCIIGVNSDQRVVSALHPSTHPPTHLLEHVIILEPCLLRPGVRVRDRTCLALLYERSCCLRCHYRFTDGLGLVGLNDGEDNKLTVHEDRRGRGEGGGGGLIGNDSWQILAA